MLVSCSLLCKKISHRKKFPSIVNSEIGYIGVKIGFEKIEEIGKESWISLSLCMKKSQVKQEKSSTTVKKYHTLER